MASTSAHSYCACWAPAAAGGPPDLQHETPQSNHHYCTAWCLHQFGHHKQAATDALHSNSALDMQLAGLRATAWAEFWRTRYHKEHGSIGNPHSLPSDDDSRGQPHLPTGEPRRPAHCCRHTCGVINSWSFTPAQQR